MISRVALRLNCFMRRWGGFRGKIRLLAVVVRGAAALLMLGSLATAGCSRTGDAPEPGRLEKSAERGPLQIVVRAQPDSVWLGDPVRVDVTFLAPADHVVRFPESEAFGDWTVSGGELSGPRPMPDGRMEWRRSYTLRTISAGVREIPPLVVQYARQPSEGEPVFDSELAAGSLKIEVRSALTTQDDVETPRDITGTLMPARRWTAGEIAIAMIAALTAMIAILGAALLLRRWMLRPAPPELPEVRALRELAALSTADWEDPHKRQAFFYRVSEIVRSYIERKFGLSAAEMTTEEFLSSLSRGPAVLPYDRERLRIFLETCDRVKYAAFQPLREDGEDTLTAARGFIHTTAAAAAAPGARENPVATERAA